MKRYEDYKKDKNRQDLNSEEIDAIKWTKYKIVVPTEEDRKELMEAFKHIHYSDVDSDFVVVNQLIHEYLDETENLNYHNNIIVNSDIYNKLNNENEI